MNMVIYAVKTAVLLLVQHKVKDVKHNKKGNNIIVITVTIIIIYLLFRCAHSKNA